MKALKLLCLFAVALVSLSFAACSDDDDDSSSSSTTTYYAICKFQSSTTKGYYFETQDGFIIYPASSSMSELVSTNGSTSLTNLLNKLVMLMYVYDSAGVSDGTTSISDVEVYSIISMQDDLEIVEYDGADNDSIADAPIISLSQSSFTPYFFDDETLVLPINYYIDTYAHYNTLVYYPNEDEDLDDGEVTLYLRHSIGMDEGASTSSSTTYEYASSYYYYYFIYYRGFNISDIVTIYEWPTTFNIVYDKSSTLSLSNASSTTYSIEYPY